jgi:ankyrin repeat protein
MSSSTNNSNNKNNDERRRDFVRFHKLPEYCQLLFEGVRCNDAAVVQQALRNGADVNCVSNDDYDDGDDDDNDHHDTTPLCEACRRGFDEIVGILLDAGADARWKDRDGLSSSILMACAGRHVSTVQLLINHDDSLLEMSSASGMTPLLVAVFYHQFDIVRFLLDRGANIYVTHRYGRMTALMYACEERDLEIVRLLLAAGVDVEARDHFHYTALHHAAIMDRVEAARELILQHNANMFAVDRDGLTPFELACRSVESLLEIYGNKLTQDHGRLALHAILRTATYSFPEDQFFHPPLNPLQIHLPLGS